MTRIAATDDMRVRTYFLGEARVAPRNYRHVLVNELAIDWPNSGSNYDAVITQAVDVNGADGRAFVTEYAGPSNIVATDRVYQARWDHDFSDYTSAHEAARWLADSELVVCDDNGVDGTCGSWHPMIDALLADYIEVPEGVSAWDFYWTDDAEMPDSDFNGVAFANAYQERVIGPGRRATELLENKPYLTRMFTIISPHEMLTDPMFHENTALAEVANRRIAERNIECDGDATWVLPSGRRVLVEGDGPWPTIGAPIYAEVVEEVPSSGAPMVLLDNRDAIATALEDHNLSVGYGDGCDCSTSRGHQGALGALTLMGLFGIGRRRRRVNASA